jgi:hypothetical protein
MINIKIGFYIFFIIKKLFYFFQLKLKVLLARKIFCEVIKMLDEILAIIMLIMIIWTIYCAVKDWNGS